MITEVDGRDVTVKLGSLLLPDGWRWAMPLTPSDWDAADFRLHSAVYDNVSFAVKVQVTGRTIQKGRVRVRIEFVQDGEPSRFHGGWLLLS